MRCSVATFPIRFSIPIGRTEQRLGKIGSSAPLNGSRRNHELT